MSGKFFLYKYEVGDVVVMRKKHPCGSNKWLLTRVGSECKMTCEGCGRQMSMDRPTLEKATSDVIRNDNEERDNG